MTNQKISTIEQLPSVRSYLHRIGAEVRSMRTAVIKEVRGNYWKDLAAIRFNRDGSIDAPAEYLPTEDEAYNIRKTIEQIQFPKLLPLANPLLSKNLPPAIKEAKPENIYFFYCEDNKASMMQVRIDTVSGKRYFPWTYWDDDVWRQMEPEGLLPLWGLDQLVEGKHTIAFIHEGAKAARAVREMVEQKTPEAIERFVSHPWGADLVNAAHLGWIGGALNPGRTDWSILAKSGIQRVYIISDNDKPGLQAVPIISQRLNLPAFHIMFTNEWPPSFDLADPFPKKMFQTIESIQRYIGPPFRSVLHPATWSTDIIPAKEKGKRPAAVLRESFKHSWSYIESADVFVCNDMPEIMLTENVLNKALAPFSHVNNVSQLIVKAFRGRTTKLCYRPDIPGRVVTDRGTSAINLHVPSDIRSSEGDPTPFLEFMTYLFPVEEELNTVLKWCATLISKPMLRMHFGLLLVTENQGIGKTTLASAILAPLVGVHNVGWPTESDVATSEFNSWLANKRLVVVNEIYSGHSWKAYNKLKSIITDSEVNVNQKHQRTYTLENWAHVIACSNSLRALRVEEDDRRWFYPLVTEAAWPRHKFATLRNWLACGGLSIIKNWSDSFVKGNGICGYIEPGERPPMTVRKKELIAGSRSEGAAAAAVFGEALVESDKAIAVTMREVIMHIRQEVQGRIYESDYEIRKAMVETGAHMWPDRIKVDGQLQYIMVSREGWRMIEGKEPHEAIAILRQLRRRASELYEVSM